MARFLFWSDLHEESWRDGFEPPRLEAPVDAVLMAGDVDHGGHLEVAARAARAYGAPVVQIWGNHEAYGSVFPDLRRREAERLAELRAEGLDLRLLHGAATEIAGVRILGATLWTDLRLYPDHEDLARASIAPFMADLREIRMTPERRFAFEDMLRLHAEDKAAIFAALREPFDGPTLVMTHHIPVRQMIAPFREIGVMKKRVVNAAFASDLWAEIREHKLDVWLCGHSHDNMAWTGEGRHGPIRFLMNSRGVPEEGCAFDPAFVVEL